jgi:acyl-homoserine lactone acylase PvdQ
MAPTKFLRLSLLFSSLLFLMVEYLAAQIPPESYFATIYRDDIGVGHVYGDYDPDVAYGIGRLIARDRPLRTMVALTCATGRSAEVFGPSYKGQLEYWLKLDRFVRAYEVPDQAQALWNRYCQSTNATDIEVRQLIVAYVQGILDEINAHGATALTTMYLSLINRHCTTWSWCVHHS